MNRPRAAIRQVNLCTTLRLSTTVMSSIALIFFGIDLDSLVRYHESKELPGSDPEYTFLWVQLHIVFLQYVEGFLQMFQMVLYSQGLN